MDTRSLRIAVFAIWGAVALTLLVGCGTTATTSAAPAVATPALPTSATFSISGTLAPAAKTSVATVTLSGAAAATTTADANGNFAFTGLSNGSYTITPSKNGLTFNPGNQAVVISGASISSVNFSGAAVLQAITVTAQSGTVAKGTTDQFTAIGTFTDGSTQDMTFSVTWNSSNPAVAAPLASGSVSAISAGSSLISATQSGVTSNSVALTVTAATLQSIAITANSVSIAKGTSDQFAATGTFSDGSTQNLTSSAVWNSSNTSAATISSSGLMTGQGVGSSNITATQSGVTSNSVALTVTAATLQSIAITANSVSIAKGTTDQFTATGTFSDGSTQNLTSSAVWNSSNTSAATVGSSGLMTGQGVGSSNITAAQSGITSNSVALTVTAATLQSIAITANSVSLAKGTTDQFTATGTFSDGSTQNLTSSAVWSSSNSAAVTISSSGLATGQAVGASNITATQSGVTSNSVALTVTAATLQSIAITANSVSIAKGTTDQFTATGTFSDGSTQNLTSSAVWSSSNTAVATISSSGLMTGQGVGSSNITATQSGVTSNSVALTVTAATLQSIAISAPGSLAAGANEQLTATGTYSDLSTQNVTSSVTWSSSNSGVASVSASGVATGTSIGQTTVSASQGSVTGTLTLSVTAVVSGNLSPSASSSGATVTLSGTASATTTADANGNYSFAGLANGSYTVTPSKGGVTFNPGSQSVTISGASDTAVNFTATLQTFTLSGTLTPASTTSGASITLSGAASASTTADASGNYSFTGLANGTYTVTPSKAGYVFGPANQQIAISSANKTGVNFSLAAGQLSIAPTSFSFGNVNLGSSSALQTGTLTATNGDVTVTTDTLSGAGFILSGVTFPVTITSGKSANFSLDFAPVAAGSASGTLSFSTNASNTPSPAGLSGTGAGVSVSPGALSFGSIPDGTASASQGGTLTAVGASITITAANVTGAFSVSGLPAVPFTIAAGQSQAYTVTFNPLSGSPGAAAGSVSFSTNVNNLTETLSGTGTPNALLSWSPSTSPNVTYNVYRCTISAAACVQSSSTNFAQIASGMTVLTYTDVSVSSGTTYYYALTAVDSNNNEGVLSGVTTVVIP